MTMDRSTRVERALPALFDELAQARTPDYLEAAIERASSRSQRPVWTLPERWLPVELVTTRVPSTRIPWRQLGVLALLAILLAAMLAVYAGSQRPLPDPFGPAVNGRVVYSKGGDVLVRDTLDGMSRPLIATADTELAESLSPRGTQVLIVRPIGELLDFFATTIDGKGEVHLGGPYLNVDGISWAPDESSVAIAHDVDGMPSISIVQADGSGARTLDLGMPANRPAWRPPDGKQLSFRGQVDGNWGLFLANADGTGVIQVPVTRELMEAPYEVLAPAWSPTGDRIAFHRLTDTPDNGNGNGFRIHVAEIDAVGGVAAQRTLAFDATSDEEMDVQWLPDGKQIVFTRHDKGTDYVSIAEPVAGARSRDVEVSTTTGDVGMLRVTLAPDGRTFIVHLWDDNSDWLVDVETGSARKLADLSGDDLVFIQRRAP
jgi:Tol biopolymer transport system component